MVSQFIIRCWLVVTAFLCTVVPLWAQDGEGEGGTEVWVLQYFIMIFFLVLALLILLRPTKREDSAFSFDEIQAQKEEEMKKIKAK